MVDIDLKGRLLMGLDITIHDITIKNYRSGTIFKDIGLTRYLQMTNLVSRKVRDLIDVDSDKIKDIKVLDIFCMNKDMARLFCDMMKFFTGYDWKIIANELFCEFHSINENEKRVHINRDNYDDILEVIKAMYCLDESKKESDRDDIDDEMRELLREFEEEEAKVSAAKGSKITIVSIIDGISSKHPSINLFNIWDYTIYQIIHTYHSLSKIDNENRIMTGIYSGCVDSKKVELEKTHWANEN